MDKDQRQQLEEAIAALEAQRPLLTDAVVDLAVAPLREKLEALQTPMLDQRKMVTVLFADVSGFTALSERMDAEDVARTMNALWDDIDRVIINFGGRIDKHIGDAVMALWGSHATREDDAERAVRAALAMQYALGLFRERTNLKLAMRIGVNTGMALLGTVGSTTEFTAIGDAVNVASRLEHIAPVGSVLISHETYQLVRGLFEMHAQEPTMVKGRSIAVQPYLVQRAIPRAFNLATRGIEGVHTVMIGREREQALLEQQLAAMHAHKTLHAVSIVGEAGVGKTRLLHEFWLPLREQFPDMPLLYGRATQTMTQRPYALLRDVLFFRADIHDNDSIDLARTKLETTISEIMGNRDDATLTIAHSIGQLVGMNWRTSPFLADILNDPQQLRNQAMRSMVQLLTTLAAQSPLVLVLEDVHWADKASLLLLNDVLSACQTAPLLVLVVARRTFLANNPEWLNTANHTHVLLNPLEPDECNQLVTALLQRLAHLPETLRDLVVSNAAGNPFYVEELIRMLIDDGVIETTTPMWTLHEDRLGMVRIPNTLTGILQARLDGLPNDQRHVLQRASVLGRVFWDQAVQQLQDEDVLSDAETTTVLGELLRRDLVYQQPMSAFAGATEYFFKHSLLRDVTYDTILKRQRKGYHSQIAEWLIAQSGERVAEYSGLVGEHLERAERNAEAANWYGLAAQQAQAAFANDDALRYYDKALHFENRWQWHKGMAEVLHLLGKRDEESAALHQLAAHADAPAADVAMLWSVYHESVSDYPAAIFAINQARAQYEDQNDLLGQARCLTQLGLIARRVGDYAQAQHWYEQALECIADDQTTEQPAAKVLIEALIGLGMVHTQTAAYTRADEAYHRGLVLSHRVNDRKGEGDSYNGLGAIHYYQRHFAEAIQYHRQALEMRRLIGDHNGEGISLYNIAIAARDSGDYEQALTLLGESLVILHRSGNRWMEINVLNELAISNQELGQFASADTQYQQALSVSQAIGDEAGEAYVLSNYGTLLRDQERYEQAVEVLHRGLEIVQIQNVPDQQAYFLSYLSSVVLEQGDALQAMEYAQSAWSLRQSLGLDERTTVNEIVVLGASHLALGNVVQALDFARQAFNVLQTHNGAGIETPQRAYDGCGEIFAAAGLIDLADVAFAAARAIVLERAQRIADAALRESFLQNVPINAKIMNQRK